MQWSSLLRAVSWLRRVPRAAWIVLTVFAALSTSAFVVKRWDARRLAAATQAGRDAERDKAAKIIDGYAAQILTLLARTDSIVRVTDTVLVTHTARARTAAQAMAAVPQSVRDREPTVAVALDACEKLVADTAAITRAVLTERVAWREVHVLDSTTIHAQAVLLVAKDDTIAQRTRERDRKPGWGKVAKVGTVALTAGVAIGKFVLSSRKAR